MINIQHGISFASKTMFVEGHWSLINRQYLFLYNRQRIEYLLYILGSQAMKKYERDYRQLNKCQKKWSCFKEFTKSWNSLCDKSSNEYYDVDEN